MMSLTFASERKSGRRTRRVYRRRASFVAMGSRVSLDVVARDPSTLIRRGESLIRSLERSWSRFDDASDVSRLNQSNGRPMRIDTSTMELLTLAVDAWRVTDGVFSPFIQPAMIKNGYVTSRGGADQRDTDRCFTAAYVAPRTSPLEIDESSRVAVLRSGYGIDLGGIGKGHAADLVLRCLLDEGARGVLADVGGDIAVGGHSPHDLGWAIDVVHPSNKRRMIDRVALDEGGIATSSTQRRRWTSNGREFHHLVDPRTGEPVQSGLIGATVLTGRAADAEVLTKVALVLGPQSAAVLLSLGVEAFLVADDGAVEHTQCANRNTALGRTALPNCEVAR